jgi:hypothetical protein
MDENVFEELQYFKKHLVQMFNKHGKARTRHIPV